MTGPTPRQLQVLRFIWANVRARGFPPTLAEIGTEIGTVSAHCVWGHLDALERKGLIQRIPRSARAITITAAGHLAIKDFEPKEAA